MKNILLLAALTSGSFICLAGPLGMTVRTAIETAMPVIISHPKLTCCLDDLEIADLDGLQDIPNAYLAKGLSLQQNKLVSLNPCAFFAMPQLTFLDLRNNPLEEIHEGAFIGVPQLERVLMSADIQPALLEKIKVELAHECPRAEIHQEAQATKSDSFDFFDALKSLFS